MPIPLTRITPPPPTVTTDTTTLLSHAQEALARIEVSIEQCKDACNKHHKVSHFFMRHIHLRRRHSHTHRISALESYCRQKIERCQANMQAEKLKGESFIHDKRTLKAEVARLREQEKGEKARKAGGGTKAVQ
ncbi:hypothetical protein MMC24_002755 [Lignoscripta atroalba]|nr:hypothetical protein [Lignoscripta atroalba]